jgi:hypothetical protein
MKLRFLFACTSMLLLSASASAAPEKLSSADEAAAFKAAGFKQKGRQWRACTDDPSPNTRGEVTEVRDLNGDGQPEAVLSEGSAFCYGDLGGYWVVSKQASGAWTLVTNDRGMPSFLASKGVGGWPDIEVGGPGFCFPVLRWNGRAYALHRHQYEGKPCKRK